MADPEYAIRVQNVSKAFRVHLERNRLLKDKILYAGRARYREFVALSDVSLDVTKGSTVGLLGVNGSGKSTLLKLISRILYPDSGSIEVHGRVSSLLELGAGFHPDFTGVENVYLNGALMGLTKKEITRKLDEIIDFSELGDFIREPIRSYSSGMYMRLAFSVAVAIEPEILLIDEILAVGDTAFQAKCMNHLRGLQKLNKTIVIVTHDTGVVERFCDHAVWLHDSRIQLQGEPESCVEAYLRTAFQEADKGASVMSFDRVDDGNTPEEQPSESDPTSPLEHGPEGLSIQSVEIACAHNETTISPGSPWACAVTMNSDMAIADAVLHIQILSEDDSLLYSADTQKEMAPAGFRMADGETKAIKLSIGRLALAPGRYYVTIRINSIDGKPYAHLDKPHEFRVHGSTLTGGYVEMEHSWSSDSALQDAEVTSLRR